MRIVCAGRGSRGDVAPILDIAAALQHCGHEVCVCVPDSFEAQAARGGFDIRCFREDSQHLMRGFGAGWKAASVALRWVARSLEEQRRVLLEASVGVDALVSGATVMMAPSVAEFRRIPYYRIAFAPILPGDQPPPLVPWQGMPRQVNRVLWRGLNAAVGLVMKRFLDAGRRKMGLASPGAVEDYFAGYGHTLLAISPWLAPPSAAWRHAYTYTGYCHGEDGHPLAEDLQAFLDAGAPPVYVGFGSVCVRNPAAFTRKVLAAAERAGCRLVLGQGWAGLGVGRLPAFAFAVEEAPHASLFPRTAGVAHHGGSGTVHTAARAGVPQLVMPQIADQFYWGARIRALGIGPQPLAPGRIRVRALAEAFRSLGSDSGMRARARALARGIGRERGLDRAIQVICGGS
ncbi:MAG: glycosyltransferase family 1 protein [Deltaproteobacteria bacterium]|nr:glycosyltransferase family 1 protein [Deltaproteobacteria bacterium]